MLALIILLIVVPLLGMETRGRQASLRPTAVRSPGSRSRSAEPSARPPLPVEPDDLRDLVRELKAMQFMDDFSGIRSKLISLEASGQVEQAEQASISIGYSPFLKGRKISNPTKVRESLLNSSHVHVYHLVKDSLPSTDGFESMDQVLNLLCSDDLDGLKVLFPEPYALTIFRMTQGTAALILAARLKAWRSFAWILHACLDGAVCLLARSHPLYIHFALALAYGEIMDYNKFFELVLNDLKSHPILLHQLFRRTLPNLMGTSSFDFLRTCLQCPSHELRAAFPPGSGSIASMLLASDAIQALNFNLLASLQDVWPLASEVWLDILSNGNYFIPLMNGALQP